MKRRKVIIVLALLGLVAALAGAITPVTVEHADCRFVLRVEGRLVDAGSSEPLTGALVLAFPVRAWATDAEEVERRRERIEMLLAWERSISPEAPIGSIPVPYVNGATTDATGAFRTLLRVSWSWTRRGCSRSRPARPPSRYGIEVLRIEIEGRKPAILDVPRGTWTEHPDDGDLWATYDLGVVDVPGP